MLLSMGENTAFCRWLQRSQLDGWPAGGSGIVGRSLADVFSVLTRVVGDSSGTGTLLAPQ
jgi:hypothetical protein